MYDIDYGELFGVEAEPAGAQEQEAADPAGDSEQESAQAQDTGAEGEAAPGRETQEDTPPGDSAPPDEGERAGAEEEPEGQSPEENARYAAARRKAEAQRDAEIERVRRQAREDAERAVDEAICGSGMTNPYTGQAITTRAELEAYQEQFRAQQQSDMQKKAGLTPEQFQAFVNTLPEVRQARAAQAQAEAAARQIREREARARIGEQLREIAGIDPAIRGMDDLAGMESYPRFCELVKRGNTFVDAFRLANYDALTQKAAQASRAAAIKAAAGKEHLTPTAQRGAGAESVPEDVRAEYRAFNPGATDEEIQKHYNRYMKK